MYICVCIIIKKALNYCLRDFILIKNVAKYKAVSRTFFLTF